jgi:Zn-dependent M28 family amino/carboxypeptidase
MKKTLGCIFVIFCLLLAACSATTASSPEPAQEFDGQRAYQDVVNQMAFGPRIPGSEAHQQAEEYIATELEKAGWQVELQQSTVTDHPVVNILAYRSKTDHPILLGAHYDSRMVANQDSDPSLAAQPVPGANDGASGVAVLLELARTLPVEEQNVWLVFFDAEDQGHIPGWNWLIGSTEFAAHLTVKPQAVVVLDMIGDADLNIYREITSTKNLTDQIWQTAASLGYSQYFIDEEKYSMLDDQTPFLNAGIPAVDVIDFDYPYWHTAQDTTDKVSAHSLEVVGKTISAWLKTQ